MSDFFNKTRPQYKGVLPYGSTEAQRYNINSGAPVGASPSSLSTQLSSYGKSQSAGRLAAAPSYATPVSPKTLSTYKPKAPPVTPLVVNNTGAQPGLGGSHTGFGGVNMDPSVGTYLPIDIPNYYDASGFSQAYTNPMDGFDSSGFSSAYSNPVSDIGGGMWDTLKGWGNGLSDLLPSNNFLFGSTKDGIKTEGALAPLVSLGSGIMNGYLGMQNLAESKRQGDFAMAAGRANLNSSLESYDTQLRDRASRRAADAQANGKKIATADEYMSQNGLSKYKV